MAGFLVASQESSPRRLNMSASVNSPSRRRPRFSIRALLLAVTLVALYFAAWEMTKRSGIGLVAPERQIADIPSPRARPFDSCPAPFVVSRERYYGLPPKYGDFREYHFWFFGYTVKLPFERLIP